MNKKVDEMTELDIENAAIASAMNHGLPEDLFVDGYGWVIRKGVATEVGIKWYTEVFLPELDATNK